MRDMRRCGALLATALVLVIALASCRREDPRLESMINLEPNPPTEDRVQELRTLIERYEQQVADAIAALTGKADALKLLAQEYTRQELYGPALDALEEAIRIQPRNHVLHYLAGVSAGFLGKSQARPDLQADYYSRAERSYELAVEIEPDYIDARYGLAVLYVFEMGEPVKALPHLRHVLEISSGHVPSLFVLARAHVALGNIDEAITAYERIIEVAPDRESRQRAERNRELLLGGSS